MKGKLLFIISLSFLLQLSYGFELEAVDSNNLKYKEKLFKALGFCSFIKQKKYKYIDDIDIFCKGRPLRKFDEYTDERFCERTIGSYISGKFLDDKPSTFIDIDSSCKGHVDFYGFSVLLLENGKYIPLPRLGENVDILAKLKDTKEAFIVKTSYMFQGNGAYLLNKCYFENKYFICETFLQTYIEYNEIEGRKLSIEKVKVDKNELVINGKLIYPLENQKEEEKQVIIKFLLNNKTGKLNLTQINLDDKTYTVEIHKDKIKEILEKKFKNQYQKIIPEKISEDNISEKFILSDGKKSFIVAKINETPIVIDTNNVYGYVKHKPILSPEKDIKNLIMFFYFTSFNIIKDTFDYEKQKYINK